jgi:hypothetical protein
MSRPECRKGFGRTGPARLALILVLVAAASDTVLAQRGRARNTSKVEIFAARDSVSRSRVPDIPSGSTATAVDLRAQLRGSSAELAQRSWEALASARVDLLSLILSEGFIGPGLSPIAQEAIRFQTELQRFEIAELRVLSASETRPNAEIAAQVRRLAVEFAQNLDSEALAGLSRFLQQAWRSLLLGSSKNPQRAFETAVYLLFIEREPEVGEAMKIQNKSERSRALDRIMNEGGRQRKWRELLDCLMGG